MQQLLGIICILTGTIGMAYCYVLEEGKRLKCYKDLKGICRQLQHEIAYGKKSLPDICLSMAGRLEDPYMQTFQAMYEEFEANQGESFAESWSRRMEKCFQKLAMRKEEWFLELPACMGYRDGQAQAEALERYIHEIDIRITERETKQQDKKKVIMSVGIMSGVLLIIVLL